MLLSNDDGLVLCHVRGLVLEQMKKCKFELPFLLFLITFNLPVIIAQQPTNPKQWVIRPEFQGRFCTPRTVIDMNSLLGVGKRKCSKKPLTRRGSKPSRSASTNNLSVICNLFNKESCSWVEFKRAHKCKGCGSKHHGVGT